MTAHTEREGLRVQVRELQRQIARLRAEHMAARDRALEEAATVADEYLGTDSFCGIAIRALKGAKP